MLNAIENIEAEQAVLGSLLIDSTLIDECTLTTEHFSKASHREIFKAMKEVNDDGDVVDIVTVTTKLERNIESIGGVSYLNDLVSSVPTTANFESHERLIKKAYRVRQAHRIASAFTLDPSEEHLEEMIKKLELIEEERSNVGESDDDVIISIYEDMYEERENVSGVPTGFADLDEITSGLQPNDLIIIAGRPSMGKTAFALNIALNASKNGVVVDFFSLEMPKKQLIQRIISSMINIDAGKWKNANRYMTTQEKEMVVQAMGTYKKYDLHIHDSPGQTVSQIRSTLRKSMKGTHDKKHLVIIDYLGLIITTEKYERKDLEIASITRSLKNMARKYNVPVVLLSQLSRGVESRQNKRPLMSDLRDSGAVEQDSDLILFLYRDDYYDRESEEKNIVEVIISKNRNGPVGSIELAFLKEYGKFLTLDKRHS